jgi:hypothetical protein
METSSERPSRFRLRTLRLAGAALVLGAAAAARPIEPPPAHIERGPESLQRDYIAREGAVSREEKIEAGIQRSESRRRWKESFSSELRIRGRAAESKLRNGAALPGRGSPARQSSALSFRVLPTAVFTTAAVLIIVFWLRIREPPEPKPR